MRPSTAVRLLLLLVAVLIGWGSAFQLLRYPARMRANLGSGLYRDFEFSKDSKTILTNDGARDGPMTSTLWDVETGRAKTAIELSDRAKIRRMRLSPDGSYLAVGDDNKVLCLWHMVAANVVTTIPNIADCNLEFSPDGQTLAYAATGLESSKVVLHLYHIHGHQSQAKLGERHGFDPCLTFSSDGKTVALAVGDSKADPSAFEVTQWDTTTLRARDTFTLRTKGRTIDYLSFSPDGRLLVACSPGARWTVWDARVRPPKEVAKFDAAPVFTPDGGEMLVADWPSKSIERWETDTMQMRSTFHCDTVSERTGWSPYRAAICTDGRQVALMCLPLDEHPTDVLDWIGQHLGLWRGDIRIPCSQVWDIATGEELARFRECVEANFSPDGKILATQSSTGEIKLWEMPPQKPIEYALGILLSSLLLACLVGSWCYGVARTLCCGRLRRAAAEHA